MKYKEKIKSLAFVMPLFLAVLCLFAMSCTGKKTELREVCGTFDTDEGKELMRQFGLPDGLMGIGSIALGYPEIVPQQPKARKENYYRIIK